MGFFSKKKEEKEVNLPRLPELPSLPSTFPDLNKEDLNNEVHELPSFPNNKMGNRFSQETIKNAISGEDNNYENKDYEDSEVIPESEFSLPPKELPQKDSIEKISPKRTEEIKSEKGPVFIRIDKFEESLEIFRETKKKIEDIEKLLSKTKELKKEEEEELSNWESEIQEMKQRVEKIDKNLFSKV